MAPEPKVRVRNLRKDFFVKVGGQQQTVHALNDVSFDVGAGEFVALTGRSGCGKTTTLRIIMGLEQASAGAIEVGGRLVTGCGYDRGMVFQHAELLPWRNALANVEFGLEVKGIPKADRRGIAMRNLDLVGLGNSWNRRPDQLSGGMKQRVGLARALAIDPDVLLMDEPFGALDAQTRESMQAELVSLHEKTRKTVIFVTHDLDEAVLLADRVFVFNPQGRIEEVVDIGIPRPRNDAVAIRGSDLFHRKRFHIWKTLKLTDDLEREAVA
jgi:NitT/TauT family transport system ATP-binding protein